jgi:hypothetical protein
MSEDEVVERCRKLEEHIAVLADYGVIPYDFAETLTEYVWKILTSPDEPVVNNVTDLRDIWKKLDDDSDSKSD